MIYKIEDNQDQYLDFLEREDELDTPEMQQKFLKYLDNWEPSDATDHWAIPFADNY